MADQLVLINGLPGAGKSTLSRELGPLLGATVLIKDTIKEALADAVGTDTFDTRQFGAVTMETVWLLASFAPGLVLVDTVVYPKRDLEHVRQGLRTAGVDRIVEVWCEVPTELAWQRYLARQRHPVHPNGPQIRDAWWAQAADTEPMALGPVISVDTTVPVDVQALAERVRVAF